MEKLLADFPNGCKKLQFKKKRHILDTSTTFVALAAPSMEGKTQSAFVMKDVIPLYFPLSEALPASGVNAPQKIYATFKELAKLLFKSAETDLKDLNKIPPSAGELKNDLDQEYWVLGLLQALQAHFENLLSSPPETWMSFYAAEFSLSFKQVSLRTFIAHPSLKKFCLFLDEFKADNWAVFVRNLSRAAGLRCIVSNTNTRIANVIGRDTASGAAAKIVWAVVIGRLNDASLKILRSDPDLDFDGSISRIREHRGDGHHLHRLRTRFLNLFLGKKGDPVLKFLDSLDGSFFENLRPGMAVLFVNALRTFCDEDLGELPAKFHFGALLDSILASLSIQLIGRKPRLSERPSAVLGKVGLLVAQSYSSLRAEGDAVASDLALICNPRSHLENHLYYLANPWKADEWAFLTFAECDTHDNKLLKVIGASNDKLVEWKMEYSYFRSEELMTALACFCVSYKHTVSRVLHDANLRVTGSGDYVFNVANEQAPSSSGNVLEVTAAACLAEASHQNHDQIFTTDGVDGMDFLRNLVRNLVYVDNYSAYSPVFIHFPSASKFDMSKFLKSCRIPFIYGWNRPVVELDKWSDSAQSCLFSNFIRCSNRAQIDGRFNFWIGKEKKSRVAVVECKNYRNGISAPKLQEILEKCLKTKNVGLSLVFGTYFSFKSRDSSNQTTTDAMKIDSKTEIQAMKEHLRDEECDEEAQARKVSFLAFCREKGINVYRLQPLAFDCEYDYSLVPFEPSLSIHNQPRLNCIVLEQTVINKREGEKVEAAKSFEVGNVMI